MTSSALFNKVLLIEDNKSHGLLIKRGLGDLVKDISEAASFKEAKTTLQAQVETDTLPDIIISDLNLPDGTASEKIKEIKEISPASPVIVLTVSTSLNDAVEAMKNGALDFIVKDFSEDFSQVLKLSLSKIKTAVDLEKEQQRLQRQMETLRSAIENSNDGLAVVDERGQIVYANASFRSIIKLLGGKPDNIGGLVTPLVNKWEGVKKSLESNLRELPVGAIWRTELTLAEKKDMAFQLSLSVLEDSRNGKERGGDVVRESVLWLRDISEEKRRERFQREILSTTTHDLKGPLGAILISSELVSKMVQSDERASELVLRIASSASSAINLIDEFLSARRIQEGTYILKPSQQKIKPLVEEVISGYEMIAEARGIKIVTTFDNADLSGMVDKLGFSRVLGNLLSNALKFTSKGGEVKVSVGSAEDEIKLQVKDTGCGMEPAEVSKIFDRFSRLDKHSNIAGSGIGLFVVKSIVTAHGGKVEVTSKSGRGTSFNLSFPLKPPVNERGELICLDFG